MSGIITQGYGKNQKIITQGYGGIIHIEVEYISRLIPKRRVKVFKRISILGDKVFKFQKEIKITGIRDLYELVLALQSEEYSEEEDIFELLYLYSTLKLEMKFKKEKIDPKTKELLKETKELLDRQLKEMKKEVDENE